MKHNLKTIKINNKLIMSFATKFFDVDMYIKLRC